MWDSVPGGAEEYTDINPNPNYLEFIFFKGKQKIFVAVNVSKIIEKYRLGFARNESDTSSAQINWETNQILIDSIDSSKRIITQSKRWKEKEIFVLVWKKEKDRSANRWNGWSFLHRLLRLLDLKDTKTKRRRREERRWRRKGAPFDKKPILGHFF